MCGENTSTTRPQNLFFRYTPHVCGENKILIGSNVSANAVQPPRVWGENRRSCSRNRLRSPVQPPRVWGKPISQYDWHFLVFGTPPRVWGKRTALPESLQHSLGTPPRVWGKLFS